MIKQLILSCQLPPEYPGLIEFKPKDFEKSVGDEPRSNNDPVSAQLSEDIKDFQPVRRANSSRINDISERMFHMSLQMLKDHVQADQSQRSSNVDASNRSLSVMDEHEANEIFVLMTKDALIAENVWGDIHRNRFLATLRDPPKDLTPDYGQDIHPSIKLDKL
jgi:hypothetical protein